MSRTDFTIPFGRPSRRLALAVVALAGLLSPALAAHSAQGEPRQPDPRVAARPASSIGWSALRAAVARIPGYRHHPPARWVLSGKYGHWGVTDWYRNTI